MVNYKTNVFALVVLFALIALIALFILTFHIVSASKPLYRPSGIIIRSSSIHGKGTFASRYFTKGATIMRAIENKKVITYANYTNHSYNPNSVLREVAPEIYDLIALIEIRKGDEITANYVNTPPFIKKPMGWWK